MADLGVDRLRLSSPLAIPVRQNHRTRDITQQFNSASEALHTGQLVKDESFSLFDSVQALEIMDPKMDTGYLAPGETLEESYDVTQDLSPEEVIWIMDELLCYEMAWQHGYPLAQNLLTSVYIYNLLVQERLPNALPYFRPLDGSQNEAPPIVQRILRTFCIGIIKSCDVILEMVQTQQYYEEEDLNTHTFALDLLTDIPDDEYFNLFADAIAWIGEQKAAGTLSSLIRSAITARLTLRTQFLNIILPSAGQSQPTTDSVKFLELLRTVIKQNTDGLKKPVEAAFSEKFQWKLASTVPPRPIIKIPFEQTVDDLGKLYQDIQEALKVDSLGFNTTIPSLAAYLWSFAFREPLTFARAVVQMFLFNEGKIAGPGDGIKALLITDLRHLVINQACIKESFWDVEVPTDPRYQIARAIDFFLEQAPTEYINVLRSLCQNRCRMRRCLTNVVKDVDTLQMDLIQYFGKDPTKDSGSSFSSLMQHAILLLVKQLESDVMKWIIQLGFEQDIYQPFEFALLQRYIAKVVEEKKVSYDFFMSQMNECKKDIMRVTGATKIICATPDNSFDFKDEEIWKGLSLLHVALARTGAIAPAKTTYATSNAQVKLRLKAFLNLNHGVPLDSLDFSMPEFAPLPLDAILKQCSEHLVVARKRIATLRKSMQDQGGPRENLEAGATKEVAEYLFDSITMALKASVRAGIAVNVLQKGLEAVEGDEKRLEGRVKATFVPPVLGCYWVVPDVKITNDQDA